MRETTAVCPVISLCPSQLSTFGCSDKFPVLARPSRLLVLAFRPGCPHQHNAKADIRTYDVVNCLFAFSCFVNSDVSVFLVASRHYEEINPIEQMFQVKRKQNLHQKQTKNR